MKLPKEFKVWRLILFFCFITLLYKMIQIPQIYVERRWATKEDLQTLQNWTHFVDTLECQRTLCCGETTLINCGYSLIKVAGTSWIRQERKGSKKVVDYRPRTYQKANHYLLCWLKWRGSYCVHSALMLRSSFILSLKPHCLVCKVTRDPVWLGFAVKHVSTGLCAILLWYCM